MKNLFLIPSSALCACAALLFLSAASTGRAAGPDKYQVTGTVTAVTDSSITVLKGKENFEMSRDASTKVSGGELKAGSKVTVQYKIAAATVEVKPEKADATKAKGAKGAKTGAATTAPGVTTGNTPQQPAATAPATKPAGR